jgi:hypothetical protein
LIVTIAFIATASAVYHSSVSSDFIPIRIDVLREEVSSSQRVITIALPDVSSLRDQIAVFGVRLRNYRLEPRRIGVVREGFPANRVLVPPDRTIDWDLVVGPAVIQALDRSHGEARSVDFAGDADGWALNAFEIRNYHARLGRGAMAVVLPKTAQGYTTGAGLLLVSLALCVLALSNALTATQVQSRPIRLIGHTLTLTAFALCLACLIVPRVSAYRLLFSPSAFLVVIAALFSPLFIYAVSAAPTLAAKMPSIWKRHDVTLERGAAVLALTAIGIAQPLFEVISNSPEFFAARNTTANVAIAAVLAIALGIPFALIAVERALRGVSSRAAAAFHGIALAALTAAVVTPWFRRGDDFISMSDAVTGALIGVALAAISFRIRVLRQFLTALAPAAVIVPALFLLDPDVRRNFLPSESAASVETIARTPPVVVVVFDELPLNSLLDASRTIDAGRYPNVAAFAREAYWFRSASTVWHNTSLAVPAILSGRYPTGKAVPTLRYYPVNLFTALARHYDISASLRFRQLCPPRACQDSAAMPGDTVRSLLSDLGLVWLHIVLPQRFTEQLPAVDGDWAEFGVSREAETDQVRIGRAAGFARFVASIDQRPARLYFIHSVIPHMPFEYVPSGRRYRAPDRETSTYRGRALFEGRSAAYADTLHQRHLAQVGFVDRLVGDLVARLRSVGVYDSALVIITSDHGASYREARSRRQPQPDNVSDVIEVPLLMKLPGQQHGEVIDRVVETVDILPTILDVVGAKASLRFDGRSLVESQVHERSSRPFLLRSRFENPPTIEEVAADRTASLERKERRFGRGDLIGLYAPPEWRSLLGTRPSRPATDVQITIRDPTMFSAVRLNRDPLPLYVRGVLHTPRQEPLTVAVVVNGVVAAVTHSYRDRNTHVFGALIPETTLRDGNNEVTALVADDVRRQP